MRRGRVWNVCCGHVWKRCGVDYNSFGCGCYPCLIRSGDRVPRKVLLICDWNGMFQFRNASRRLRKVECRGDRLRRVAAMDETG
jgi:hypothetical protein